MFDNVLILLAQPERTSQPGLDYKRFCSWSEEFLDLILFAVFMESTVLASGSRMRVFHIVVPSFDPALAWLYVYNHLRVPLDLASSPGALQVGFHAVFVTKYSLMRAHQRGCSYSARSI